MKGNKQSAGLGWMATPMWREDGAGISLEISIEPSVALCRLLHEYVQQLSSTIRGAYEWTDVQHLSLCLLEVSEVRAESVPVIFSALRMCGEAFGPLVLQTTGALVCDGDRLLLRFQQEGSSWRELQVRLEELLAREGFILNKKIDLEATVAWRSGEVAAESFVVSSLSGFSSMFMDLLVFERTMRVGKQPNNLLAFCPLLGGARK